MACEIAPRSLAVRLRGSSRTGKFVSNINDEVIQIGGIRETSLKLRSAFSAHGCATGQRMRSTDILIAGGGLAGSTAAAMLGRAGYATVLVDPHPVYPPDFRAEKLDGTQTAVLRKTGVGDAVLRAATHDGENWVARFGRLIEKRPGDQHGILYDTMVNTMRGEIPPGVDVVHAKVMDVATSADRQTVTLSDGEQISARLVVIANGLNIGLRHKLGMERREISKTHSIMLGFDLVPASRASFSFPALTYYGEHPSDRAAYITLFPIQQTMRANLCVYRDMDDPWLRHFREAPREELMALMPGLAAITGAYDVPGRVQIRPADLYVTEGVDKPGVVLIGDAFSTSCPIAGTGTGKVFTDVERLCNVYIPRWLATSGMGANKIAAFYADPVRAAYHAHSAHKAFHLRSLTIDAGLKWAAQRWTRFVARAAIGMLREVFAPAPQPDATGRSQRSLPAIDAAGTAPRAFARHTTQRR
jgi:2-polyprenyl-6-methoxyphenol hydroxylase-like FAD-dependent oxidoreductase